MLYRICPFLCNIIVVVIAIISATVGTTRFPLIMLLKRNKFFFFHEHFIKRGELLRHFYFLNNNLVGIRIRIRPYLLIYIKIFLVMQISRRLTSRERSTGLGRRKTGKRRRRQPRSRGRAGNRVNKRGRGSN